jgi:hypothetical protein
MLLTLSISELGERQEDALSLTLLGWADGANPGNRKSLVSGGKSGFCERGHSRKVGFFSTGFSRLSGALTKIK